MNPKNLQLASAVMLALAAIALIPAGVLASDPPESKPATAATKSANKEVLEVLAKLAFSDREDKERFEDAQRGFIARPDTLIIKNADGKEVWNLEHYKFIKPDPDQAAPDTVNPSLWRNAQLNMLYGLFQVTDDIYQVRGYDLSNITFIKGNTGWIVFDPLISSETAKAAYDLVTKHLGKRPVLAVVYSHSHVDHYGGVRGIIDKAGIKTGKVKIIAPEGFLHHAVSENVIAGNAMSRRAIFMYGSLLPRGPKGSVGSGLGQTTSRGTVTLIPPTETITKTGQELTVDGVRMVFQMTPGTEAPAEMNTWFPEWKAFWSAENATHTMHNILTLRGAQVRDAKTWAHYLDEAINEYGKNAAVVFQSHHWPVWGNERVVDHLKKQRDVYKYMHDQTVNLMNKGYTGEEIAEKIEFPPELEQNWSTRGYYGTLKHNSRAIYQFYMGWYDGNPANLDQLPPEPAAKRYVEYMGGEKEVLKRARADFAKGNYRWVAQVVKHVVFANPDNTKAKRLLADAFEQMGYQAESGPWRSVYLQGALELREKFKDPPPIGSTASPDVIKETEPEMLFDYLAVRLNGPAAAGKTIRLNIDFTDLEEGEYGLTVENAVLNYNSEEVHEPPDSKALLSKATLDSILLGETTIKEALESGDLKLKGPKEPFCAFLDLLDDFPPWFNIVTPRESGNQKKQPACEEN